MQLNLLQDDLFSTVGETLPAAASTPKKTRSKKTAAPTLEADASPASVIEQPVVITMTTSQPETAPEALEAAAAPEPEYTHSSIEEKAPGAFKTISEVAEFLGLPQHVLRFWESKFSQIKPVKLRGGRRYYRPDDIEVLSTIKHLLYKQGYTINGAKKAFSQGKNALIEAMHAEEGVKPAPLPTPKINEKQKQQLASIRHELYSLRETLKPYMEQHA